MHRNTNREIHNYWSKFNQNDALWSSKEEVKANLDKIRTAAGSAVGVSVTGAMQGNVVLELD